MKDKVSKRLLASATLVREGAILADVGTDHAYLPIYLLSEGKIKRAYLSDVNEGPLENAKENVHKAGLTSLVDFRLCNGASELAELGITDYAICGMGGELIADIIEHAPHLKDKSVNLILQPMTKADVLRRYLFENGFDILKEIYVSEDDKHYLCILAAYVGGRVSFSEADVNFGQKRFFNGEKSSSRDEYMQKKQSALIRMIEGKRRGGENTEREEQLLLALRERLNSTSQEETV